MGLTTNRPLYVYQKDIIDAYMCKNYMNNENFIFAQQNYRMIRIIILNILNHLKSGPKTWAIIKSPKSYDSKTWSLFFAFFFFNELIEVFGRPGADVTLSNDLPDGLAGTVTFGMDSMVSKLGNSRFTLWLCQTSLLKMIIYI